MSVNATSFYKTNVVCIVPRGAPAASLGHELTHVIAMNQWGLPDRWLNEGLAVAFDGRVFAHPLHNLAKHLRERGQLPSVAEVTGRFTRLPNRASHPAAGSFVRYLLDSFGLEAVRQVFQKGARALPAATGLNWREIERGWLETVDAANSAGIEYEVE